MKSRARYSCSTTALDLAEFTMPSVQKHYTLRLKQRLCWPFCPMLGRSMKQASPSSFLVAARFRTRLCFAASAYSLRRRYGLSKERVIDQKKRDTLISNRG